MRQVIFLIAGLILFTNHISAQKVTRKGMKPLMHGNTASTPVGLYTIDQLNGKWQEIKRSSSSGDGPGFTDTLLLAVNNGRGSLKTNMDMSMAMNGPVAIDAPASLEIAGSAYNIIKLDKNMLVLQDEEFTRTLKRVNMFYYETVGKDSLKFPSYTTAIVPDMKNLEGKWEVYRRQAAPGFANASSTLIKSFIVSAETNSTQKIDMVTYNGDNISTESSGTVSISGGKVNVVSDKGTMFFNVYKADGNELIFGDVNGVMNYAKHP